MIIQDCNNVIVIVGIFNILPRAFFDIKENRYLAFNSKQKLFLWPVNFFRRYLGHKCKPTYVILKLAAYKAIIRKQIIFYFYIWQKMYPKIRWNCFQNYLMSKNPLNAICTYRWLIIHCCFAKRTKMSFSPISYWVLYLSIMTHFHELSWFDFICSRFIFTFNNNKFQR